MMGVMKFVESLSEYSSSSEDGSGVESLSILADQNQSPRPFFLAKITGTSDISDNRYLYSFVEVELAVGTATNGYTTVVGGQTGSTALNLCEISNTATDVGTGVALDGSGYPSGFDMMRIGLSAGGTLLMVVIMFNVRDIRGQIRQVFFATNSHDGSCS